MTISNMQKIPITYIHKPFVYSSLCQPELVDGELKIIQGEQHERT
jgi:hypothetical protein